MSRIEAHNMSTDDLTHYHFYNIPTEILLYIFTFLSAKHLVKCRLVCVQWKIIVDELTRKESLWRALCKEDYKIIHMVARQKARPGLLWYNVYKSLALWSKINAAREIHDEFASASVVNEQIQDFVILQNGIVGVHKRKSIVYYDIETLEQSSRGSITGDYLRYTENNETLLIVDYHLHLYIIRKFTDNSRLEPNATFDNVKLFLLANRDIFYVTLNDDIYVCKLDEDKLTAKYICRSGSGIMCLGFSNNNLNILTFQRDIFVVKNSQFVLVNTIGQESNILDILRQYNFLEHLDWRVYLQWMYLLNHTIPQGPMRDMIMVRTYGDVVFVGSNYGVLRIYYSPITDGELDLFNSEPIKQYNFMERSDCPVLSTCPIIQIDVLEAEDGHTVLIAMPKKIAVLELTHSFKRSASVAMLPYSGVQKVKMLKIDDSTQL